MVQASFLPKYCADQGLLSWRKFLSPVTTQGLEGGYKTPATRALLQHWILHNSRGLRWELKPFFFQNLVRFNKFFILLFRMVTLES